MDRVKEIMKMAEAPDLSPQEAALILKKLAELDALHIIENADAIKEGIEKVKIADLTPTDVALQVLELSEARVKELMGALGQEHENDKKIAEIFWRGYLMGRKDAVNNLLEKTAEKSKLGEVLDKIADMITTLDVDNETLRAENKTLSVQSEVNKIAERLVKTGRARDLDSAKLMISEVISDVHDPEEAIKVLNKFASTFNLDDEGIFL